MRVGVEASCWTQRRGYGRQLRGLLGAALELDRRRRYLFFVDSEEAAAQTPSGGEVVRIRASRPAARAARSDGRRSLADLWAASRALACGDLDCLLFPTVYTYVPVLSRASKIVMIHDLIPEKFPERVFPTAAGRRYWQWKSFLARRQADRILTVSEFSRRGILEHFGERPERVQVVGEAADPVFRVLQNPVLPEGLRRQGIRPQDRLLVFVGGFSPHKNLLGLLDAFAALAGAGDLRLILVGDYQLDAFYSCHEQVRRRIGEPPLAGRVILTGYLSDPELVALLNVATALVLPSFLEGFGLPAVEAAACGLPVVATSASPLAELLGDGALFINPGDPPALRAALERILSDEALRRRLREQGLRAAAALSWSRAARQLLDVLDQLAPDHAQAA